MRVTKAVIPAAGLGTRMLPASKAIPKEMIPIVDKPAIQYIVEEAVAAGIRDILIILSRGKTVVEDHFDRSPELEKRLLESGKEELCRQMTDIAGAARIHYVRQQEMLGLGHAVAQARAFVGDEPFAVLYGDDVVIGEVSATAELCAAYEKYGLGVAGIKPVPVEQLTRYSSLRVEAWQDGCCRITDMIEKPRPGEEFSNYSILGRCVLPPKIFDILDRTPRGAGGEIQLTDAMRELTLTDGMIGVEYSGTRCDMGNKLAYLQACVEQALRHPEIGGEFTAYLKQLAKGLCV